MQNNDCVTYFPRPEGTSSLYQLHLSRSASLAFLLGARLLRGRHWLSFSASLPARLLVQGKPPREVEIFGIVQAVAEGVESRGEVVGEI